jgi:hypothetical protein
VSASALAPVAVPSAVRNPTRGYAEIPNSLIENQAILTRAELSLALIVLRRAGPDGSAKISDSNWQSWTGLSPRNKEYAAAGLKAKGLVVEGRGDQALYSFRRSAWDDYVRQAERDARPRTLGRPKAVSPKPGAKVHPDCAESGCAMMCAPERLTFVPATPVAQPVAQINHAPASGRMGLGDLIALETKTATPTAATPNAQPVAQTASAIAKQWEGTLLALRCVFPFIGFKFLGRLVATVRRSFPSVSDSELAEAVAIAWQRKKRFQKGEGLFLFTVPEAVAVLQNKPAPAPPSDTSMLLKRQITAAAKCLHERGGEFSKLAGRLVDIGRMIDETDDLENVQAQLEEVEQRVIVLARASLNLPEREIIGRAVEAQTRRYVGKMSAAQLEGLAAQIAARETLSLLNIPRLGVLYA